MLHPKHPKTKHLELLKRGEANYFRNIFKSKNNIAFRPK